MPRRIRAVYWARQDGRYELWESAEPAQHGQLVGAGRTRGSLRGYSVVAHDWSDVATRPDDASADVPGHLKKGSWDGEADVPIPSRGGLRTAPPQSEEVVMFHVKRSTVGITSGNEDGGNGGRARG